MPQSAAAQQSIAVIRALPSGAFAALAIVFKIGVEFILIQADNGSTNNLFKGQVRGRSRVGKASVKYRLALFKIKPLCPDIRETALLKGSGIKYLLNAF